MPVSGRLAAIAQRKHQIRSIDPLGILMPVQPTEPDQRHAVGGRESAGVDDLTQARVALTLHDRVYGAHIDVMSDAVRDPTLDFTHGPLQVDSTDADTQNVDARELTHGVARVSFIMKLTESLPAPARVVSGSSAGNRTLARAARIVVLGAGDMSALVVSGLAAYLLWALPARGQSLDLYWQLAPL